MMSKMRGISASLRRLSTFRTSRSRMIPFLSPMTQKLAFQSSSAIGEPQMMCFQCEQTHGGKGCTTVGVCSKTPQLAGLQDLQMLYNLRLCQLAHTLGATNAFASDARRLVLESTFATLTNVNFDDERFREYLVEAANLTTAMETLLKDTLGAKAVPVDLPGLPRDLPNDMIDLLRASRNAGLIHRSKQVRNDDLFGVVEMAIYGLKGVMAYFHHAEHLGIGTASYSEQERLEVYNEIFRIGAYLATASTSAPSDNTALQVALKECLAIGAVNLQVMKLLDQSHCTAFGSPSPTEVSTTNVGGKPSILVSGHDLGVLYKLCEQSQGRGVDIYTHGEMLPAHGYPKLRAFENLKGHFGTHWGNQLHEFKHFPGVVLMTSNCLRPPTRNYSDRLWTCGPVGFHNCRAVNGDDFGPLIDQALTLPAFDGEANRAALHESSQREQLLVGFGHDAVLGVADKVVNAIKSGALNHVFVIGGCDGTEASRNYFTDLAEKTPADSIILTLGCGKFRLNSTDHGTLGGLPRLIDVGQCNDAYSAIVIAVKLAEALGCSVHDLPLHFAVSWFEQKAVAVLLTLLHLDMKNIRIGPAVPAFLTPQVVNVLNDKFGLMGINIHDEAQDLANMLRGQ
eukprot:TRINITY_DN55307_c0_g1_i1.p1 TRINITY_DN55307_c0_g1~~TRINITY_DN55307_c0_g1_i1.p1  ORF type:complete len:647 (-),score=84.34 TRINITY_DN55307_c0_g1_i1:110-1981(-)